MRPLRRSVPRAALSLSRLDKTTFGSPVTGCLSGRREKRRIPTPVRAASRITFRLRPVWRNPTGGEEISFLLSVPALLFCPRPHPRLATSQRPSYPQLAEEHHSDCCEPEDALAERLPQNREMVVQGASTGRAGRPHDCRRDGGVTLVGCHGEQWPTATRCTTQMQPHPSARV